MAWFPQLFYSTVYIGEVYKRSMPPPVDEAAAEELAAEGTILGSRAMFYYAIVVLCANFIMPLFVLNENKEAGAKEMPIPKKSSFLRRLRVIHLCELWAFSHLLFALSMWAT